MSDLLEQELPGWRPDPSGRYEWRYWDGGWTNRVANSAPQADGDAAPSGASSSAAGPAESEESDEAPSAAEAAVAADAESSRPLTARDAVPRVPFGTEPAAASVAATPRPG